MNNLDANTVASQFRAANPRVNKNVFKVRIPPKGGPDDYFVSAYEGTPEAFEVHSTLEFLLKRLDDMQIGILSNTQGMLQQLATLVAASNPQAAMEAAQATSVGAKIIAPGGRPLIN